MGLLVNGKWVDKWYDTKSTDGEFKRESSKLHHWITCDGKPGPSGKEGFIAESVDFLSHQTSLLFQSQND